MARPKSLKPAYCLHKSSGRAFVKLDGHRVYLGCHGTQESRDAYDRAIGEWIARGRSLPVRGPADDGPAPAGRLVKEVVAAFWTYAGDYYVNADRSPAAELENYRCALRPLNRLYGPTPAADFGPLAMKALMQEMVTLGWCRKYVNRQAARVKAVFKWAVGNELIPPSVHQALIAVPGFRKGKSAARESAPVKPVPDTHVDAALRHLPRHVRAMVELQVLTGMRPGEVCLLRGCDIDATGDVWTYRPAQHKTAHLDDDRVIDFGPRCRKVLEPFLKPDLSAYLFSPAEAEAERRARLHAARKTPLSCGNAPGTNRATDPKWSAGDRYDVASYRRAIARACDAAFPPPDPLARRDGESAGAWRSRLTPEQRKELAAWQKAHRWHPHQLRHNAATRFRKEYGIDVARIILGHKSDSTTSIYAERDRSKAREVMSRVG